MAPSKKLSKKDRVEALAGYAEEKYGDAANRKRLAILDQLITSLMARRTNHSRADKCIECMHKEFVDWNEVRVSTLTQIALTMGRNEWTQEVAEDIRHLLETLYATEHEVSLDFLLEMTPTQIRSYLMKLPNVDRPTADEVMLLSLGIPTLPYDEAQALTFYQMGLVADERVTVTNQRSVEKLFAPEQLPALHFFLSEHSVPRCVEASDQCEECPLTKLCGSSRRKSSSSSRGKSRSKSKKSTRKRKAKSKKTS